jgi:hypothetical protein
MQEHQRIIKSLLAHISQNLKKEKFMSYKYVSSATSEPRPLMH